MASNEGWWESREKSRAEDEWRDEPLKIVWTVKKKVPIGRPIIATVKKRSL